MSSPSSSSTKLDTFVSLLSSDNAPYIAHLYDTYQTKPDLVDPKWRSFFDTLPDQQIPSPPPAQKGKVSIPPETLGKSLQAMALIRAYRTYGYRLAHLDPLNLVPRDIPLDLLPETYGFTSKDRTLPILIEGQKKPTPVSLESLIKKFDSLYQGTIGMEFMHLEDLERRAWIQKQMEGEGDAPPLTQSPLGTAEKKEILRKLIEAKNFEQFLQKKYPITHRFSLEGAKSLIPGLEEAFLQSAILGVQDIVIGMAHRGRLNVLANIVNKPLKDIFYQFQSNEIPSPFGTKKTGGDVMYHLGISTDRDFQGHPLHLSLLDTPSHLEAIDPIVLGKVRAQQMLRKDTTCNEVMGLLIHGDAAFRGQGIVSETLMLSSSEGYTTGGTLHIILNNQIGFTTTANSPYASIYCADLAVAFQIPVLHVNGDDPEGVVKVLRLAAQYRHKFKTDIIVNLVCYRRHGHNEGDESAFTQPLMSKAIMHHPSLCESYTQKLLREKIITQHEVDVLEEKNQALLRKGFSETKDSLPASPSPHRHWEKLNIDASSKENPKTGIKKGLLLDIGASLDKTPKTFHLHPKLAHILATRRELATDSERIDWSLGEALAFGSLLLEGHHVRLSGQDSERGTFSHRHAVLIDQTTEEKYIPLNHLSKNQARFEIWNSPLAEFSVLGFELGYSFADPQSLVLWEAQYGDFSNEAQVIVDQFLSSSEEKWLRFSGLVMLLPHGYEGQGPEHSSARLERYLQLCGQDNMQVVNCTTPANYFHVLRRQVHTSYRKPLIIMTPKSLLRHKQATSPLQDIEEDTQFQTVISDHNYTADRIILCSGKVYYDLLKACTEQRLKSISLVRLEQLYPFPHDTLLTVLSPYKKTVDVIWCQEEPMNMGAWTFIDRRLESVLLDLKMHTSRPSYVGRPEAASPATGSFYCHVQEQNRLINQALNQK